MIHPCICFFFGPCNCQTLSLVAYIRHRQLFLHHKNQITTNGLNKVPALLLFIFFIIYLFSISCYTRMYVTIQTLKKKKKAWLRPLQCIFDGPLPCFRICLISFLPPLLCSSVHSFSYC